MKKEQHKSHMQKTIDFNSSQHDCENLLFYKKYFLTLCIYIYLRNNFTSRGSLLYIVVSWDMINIQSHLTNCDGNTDHRCRAAFKTTHRYSITVCGAHANAYVTRM